MAAPHVESSPDQGDGERPSMNVQTFKQPEPSQEPGPLEPEERTTQRSRRPKGLLTILALVGAMGLAAATVALVQEPLEMSEMVILGALATLIALLGLLPMRRGWYVMAGVTVAFYLLNLFNQLNPENTVFELYRGSSYTFAILMPAVGVAAGGLMQVVYRLVGGE